MSGGKTRCDLPWADGRAHAAQCLQECCCCFAAAALLLLLSCCSRVQLCATPWTAAHQAPLSMGTLQARVLEWAAMPSSRGSSPPGIKPRCPALRAGSLPLSHQGSPLARIRSDQISRSVMSNSLRPRESQHSRPPCPSPTPRVH